MQLNWLQMCICLRRSIIRVSLFSFRMCVDFLCFNIRADSRQKHTWQNIGV